MIARFFRSRPGMNLNPNPVASPPERPPKNPPKTVPTPGKRAEPIPAPYDAPPIIETVPATA